MHSATITVFRVRLLLLAMALALIGTVGRDGKERLAEINPARTSGATSAVPGFEAMPAVSGVYSPVNDDHAHDHRRRGKGTSKAIRTGSGYLGLDELSKFGAAQTSRLAENKVNDGLVSSPPSAAPVLSPL